MSMTAEATRNHKKLCEPNQNPFISAARLFAGDTITVGSLGLPSVFRKVYRNPHRIVNTKLGKPTIPRARRKPLLCPFIFGRPPGPLNTVHLESKMLNSFATAPSRQ